ncbi:conserved Plasmodium protein, unknown function [Plasmodium berghei]|uniref:Phosphoglycerate mutase n=2 Tax=Plasmodium berghei TaxID=5821 RepID=A0A509AK54_PLABA|nr:conserved Plasmodium protein, unknown function [Plasmodium berghei ANKA]CXI55743.1 conserved Plasmodium protein, unknown function [Plasmodium berghei]SCL95235.1 conserved Plasmodium protein, unknown function [Plasmodium berghei]SCM16204.1 conserved Plasmodium protein, unknown function [Plasmodium berghei]SCM18000.1 conserved Plasmodium protein, unknown function [Plasmodium berghei]SCN26407.1 conserved Plasmodium protein, unknown function [Plasmodium berghei]|eukprot:XP_034422128.1 conserved Plasmodium protein, unknown function [Plasmodium berghei ANKA]
MIVVAIFAIFSILFIFSGVFEYIHRRNSRRTQYINSKRVKNKKLGNIVLHGHMLKDSFASTLNNFFCKLKIINNVFLRYVSYNESELVKNNSKETKNGDIPQEKNYENAKVKTIYFIRHAESVWNSVINKKISAQMIIDLGLLLMYELCLLFDKKTLLVDSPLSNAGVMQSIELLNFLNQGQNGINQESLICYREPCNNTKEDDLKNKSEKSMELIRKGSIKNLYKKTRRKKKTDNDTSNGKGEKKKNDVNQTLDNEYFKFLIENINNNNKSDDAMSIQNFDNENNNGENDDSDMYTEISNDEKKYDPDAIINLSIEDHIKIINNTSKYESSILCSDLRRTISTCFISLYNRINTSKDSVSVLNSLQEISRNPDCIPLFSYYDNKYIKSEVESVFYKKVGKLLKTKIHLRNKKSKNKFVDTLDYIFSKDNDIFIVFGHSNWFKIFFNNFLRSPHISKTNKIKNSGIVVFNMIKSDHNGTPYYEIQENSIRSIYKGFEGSENEELQKAS